MTYQSCLSAFMKPSATTIDTVTLPTPWLIYIKLTLVALLWGGTFIAGRFLAESLPAISAATGRFSIAVLLLLLLVWKFEGGLPRLTLRQTLTTCALGVTGVFLYNIGFFGCTGCPAFSFTKADAV